MKKLSGIIVVAIVSVLFFTAATNSVTKKKKGWKGSITYALSYEGEGITPASVASSPKQAVIKVMGNKSAVEIVQGYTIITIIKNPEFNLSVQLIEVGEKKFAIKNKLSEEENDSLRQYDVEVDLVNETKIIAGYECKKAVVTWIPRDTALGEEQIFNYYYSSELGSENSNEGGQLAEIPGMLMEFQQIIGKMIMKYQATEVKKGGVKEADFLIPTDYKIVTAEELQKEFSN